MIYIREDLKPLFERERTVADFLRIDGEVYKHVVQSRRTLRFERSGKAFFLKAHWGVGWKEIFKNLVSLRRPILGARNEWLAIQALNDIGVDTMRIAAYGAEGLNPARIKSFLVTEALEHTVDLEHWLPLLQQDCRRPQCVRLKRAVMRKVAEIARKLHSHGMNHRDLYLCHFRVDLSDGASYPEPEHLRIYLMDLHRAQIRRKTPARWIIKDISALLYSSLYACKGLRLSRTDYLRFVQAYVGDDWRRSLINQQRFWRRVVRRAIRTGLKTIKTPPPVPQVLLRVLD